MIGMNKKLGRGAGALLAGTAAFALGAGARAQTLDEPNEAEVTLNPIVVTASGGPTDLRDAPASITVVTQDEMRNTAAQDVRGVLSRIEGITIGRGGNMNTV